MENVRKGETACNKQFLLFSQCFVPYMALIFHFNSTSKCRLQFVSIWTSLKNLPFGNGLKEYHIPYKEIIMEKTTYCKRRFANRKSRKMAQNYY